MSSGNASKDDQPMRTIALSFMFVTLILKNFLPSLTPFDNLADAKTFGALTRNGTVQMFHTLSVLS